MPCCTVIRIPAFILTRFTSCSSRTKQTTAVFTFLTSSLSFFSHFFLNVFSLFRFAPHHLLCCYCTRRPCCQFMAHYSDSSEEELPMTAALELAMQLEDASSLFPRALKPYLLSSIASITAAVPGKEARKATLDERNLWSSEVRATFFDALRAEASPVVRGVVFLEHASRRPTDSCGDVTETVNSNSGEATLVSAVPVEFSYSGGFARADRRADESDSETADVRHRYESLLTLLLQKCGLGRPD